VTQPSISPEVAMMTEWLDLIVVLVVIMFIFGVFIRLATLFKTPATDNKTQHEEKYSDIIKLKNKLIKND
jgi:hypothetical protein